MVLLEPEIITTIAGLKITNSLIATLLTDFVLVTIVFFVYKKINKIPNYLQNIVEIALDYFHTLTQEIAGHNAPQIFPWFASFFFAIFFSNILGLLPGFGTIGFFHTVEGRREFVPLLRAATSDFNATLALATVSLFATHILAIRATGIKDYLKRFFSFNPILLFVGILELISEFTKLFSLSFRLFGNIFAGEVVMSTISSLFAFIAPLPFLFLEIIVAFVQALVFSMLTMVFMSILATKHAEGGEH